MIPCSLVAFLLISSSKYSVTESVPSKPTFNFSNCRNSSYLVDLFSTLSLWETSSIPDSQRWSRCKFCAWSHNSFHAFVNKSHISKEIVDDTLVVSWSQWGEFFHAQQNDIITVKVTASAIDTFIPPLHHQATRRELSICIGNDQILVVENPVYVLPLITYHPGHILIDILEQLYHSMIMSYGKIRKDSIIIISVSNLAEIEVLQEKLDLNDDSDSIGSLLQLFSGHHILAFETFTALLSSNTMVVFSDIHFGMDMSRSFFHLGFKYHPCIFHLKNSHSLKAVAKDYKSFQQHIWQIFDINNIANIDLSLIANSPRSSNTVNVLLIHRASNRIILNLDELQQKMCQNFESWTINCTAVDLGLLSFSKQLAIFATTDILIGVAGTAIHNILFMKPNSAVIIIMQPGWCDWSWMYANQAVLLDIKHYVYCTPEPLYAVGSLFDGNDSIVDRTSYNYLTPHWTRKSVVQGPRMTKSANVSVSIDAFYEIFKSALTERYLSATDDPICTGKKVSEGREARRNTEGRSAPKQEVSVLKSRNVSVLPGMDIRAMPTSQRVVEVYISSVSVTALGPSRWTVGIMGEFGIEYQRRRLFANLGDSILSVCMAVPDVAANADPLCYPMETFNYLSDVFFTLEEPRFFLHLWLQASPDGGKFRGSDVYTALDVRLPEAGLSLQSEFIDSHFVVDLLLPINNALRTSAVVRFEHFFTTRLAFQRHTADFCHLHGLGPLACCRVAGQLLNEMHRRTEARRLRLPAFQSLPTRHNPFVFLHIEKTAGTTLREFIAESSEVLGLQYFIPCHNGLHCVTMALTDPYPEHNGSALSNLVGNYSLSNVSVVAGHFFWGVWNFLPAFQETVANSQVVAAEAGKTSLTTAATPHCFVMGRHPVDRVISYYYQRCYQISDCVGYQRRINELRPEELHHIVINERQGNYKADNTTVVVLDEGMSDAACRTVGGWKATSGLVVGVDDIKLPDPLTPAQTKQALENIDSCVVGLQERWPETQAVLRFWYPWLDFTVDPNRRKMHLFSGKETRKTLRPDLYEVVRSLNQCDMELHERMVQRFERELHVLAIETFL